MVILIIPQLNLPVCDRWEWLSVVAQITAALLEVATLCEQINKLKYMFMVFDLTKLYFLSQSEKRNRKVGIEMEYEIVYIYSFVPGLY